MVIFSVIQKSLKSIYTKISSDNFTIGKLKLRYSSQNAESSKGEIVYDSSFSISIRKSIEQKSTVFGPV